MKEALARAYGPPSVLTVADAPIPRPGATDVLVEVRSTAVTAGDLRIRAARFPAGFAPFARAFFGFTRPRSPVLGGTYSGVVAEVGSKVTGIAVGDRVAGMTGARMGCHAQFVVVRKARSLAHLPESLHHRDSAALLFGATAALTYVRDKLAVASGESVAVVGAAGAVGLCAVQLARNAGATVTAVANGEHTDTLAALGADAVIDSRSATVFDSGARFDVVVDTTGTISPRDAARLLAPGGRLGLLAATLGQTVRARGAVKAGPTSEKAADIAHVLELAATGQLRPIVDREFGLDEIVAAHERAETRGRIGSVVVNP